ncbi:MAG: methylated-DNA--[protein]-cysteine S-methyltransferase [Xanthobacteraceae bacterium]|nr:methylated-DNA--[protein]-cysteine S-methyltransferase [Xanthobacteraceae bacterium]
MTAAYFAVFETAIGVCGIAWTERGVCRVQLPEQDAEATRARLGRRLHGARETAPADAIRRTIDDVKALLAGRPRDLSEVPLDLQGVPAFHQRVYAAARRIRAGGTASYGEIATQVGEPGAARAVGQALGRNPVPLIVPCHRVLATGGKFGGFSGFGGVATKMRLLAIEGAILPVEGHPPQLVRSAFRA